MRVVRPERMSWPTKTKEAPGNSADISGRSGSGFPFHHLLRPERVMPPKSDEHAFLLILTFLTCPGV